MFKCPLSKDQKCLKRRKEGTGRNFLQILFIHLSIDVTIEEALVVNLRTSVAGHGNLLYRGPKTVSVKRRAKSSGTNIDL